MNDKVYINYDEIEGSINTLSYIDDILSTTDLTTDFEDMESYFRDINFEHANCIKYKEAFDAIYDDLDYIRKKINQLKESLISASIINKNNEKEIAENLNNCGPYVASLRSVKRFLLAEIEKFGTDENVTTIPAPTTEEKDTGYINTLPIGVAIGTAGIVGSIGTILFNEYYLANRNKPQKKMEFEQYNVSDTFASDDDYKSMVTNDYFKTPSMYGVSESNGAYSAHRRNNDKNVIFSDEVESEVNLPDVDEDDENDKIDE